MSKPSITTDPAGYAPAFDVIGESITVLASDAAASGCEVFLHRGDEGIGPPPHIHEWDESCLFSAASWSSRSATGP